MPTYDAGDARIRIIPDSSRFLVDLERDLARKRAEFAVSVTADTTRADTDIDAFLARQSRRDVTLDVRVDTRHAEASLAALERAVGPIGGGGGPATAGGGGGLGVLAAGGLTLAVGAIPSAVTLVSDLAGAVQQLSGAGLVLPGALAGIATSVGTANLAFSGLGDALGAVVESADGTEESLKKAETAMLGLAPAAREVITTVAQYQPLFEQLKATTQQNVFGGLDEQITTLINTQFPTVERGLANVASAWNGTFTELLDVGSSQGTTRLLDRLFGNTADAQRIANEAIDPISRALGNLIGAGSDALPRLAGDVDSVARRLDVWLSDAASDGRLDKWINSGITGLEDLGSSVVNVADAFGSIADAAPDDLLGGLEDVTGKFADYLNSAEGQKKINELIEQGSEQLSTMLDTVSNLGPVFGSMFDSATTSFGFVNETLGVVASAMNALQTHAPGLGNVLTSALNPLLGAKRVIDAMNDTLDNKIPQLLADAEKNRPVVTPITNARFEGGVGMSVGALPFQAGADLDRYGAKAAETQRKIDSLGDAVRTLPDGSVELTDNTPDVLNKVEALELRVKEINGKLYLSVDDTAANATMTAFVDRWSQAVINPRLSVPGQAPAVGQPGQITTANPFASPRDDYGNPVYTGPSPGNPFLPPTTPPKVSTADTFPFPLPTGATGGPTPAGSGPGPTGGYLAEIHPNEWVLPEHARRQVGDHALWALTQGRSFADGGFIDAFGNPVTPGPLPGPAAGMASPSGYGEGAFGSIANSFLSSLGVGSPLGGLLGGGNSTGAVGSDQPRLLPGLAGLAQAGGDPELLDAWGKQTGDWLGTFGANALLSFGSTLWKGLLGTVGLENSILSPDNAWFKAGAESLGFFLGDDGPLGQGTATDSGGSTGSKAPSAKQAREAQQKASRAQQRIAEINARIGELAPDAKGSQRMALQNDLLNAQQDADDANADLATLMGGASPAALRANTFAQTHAVGQPYSYGGVGNGGYDCSGIASAIYAASRGLPQGQRYFTTESDFAALGFQEGYLPGALNIGVRRGGGGRNSHMAVTLPNGVNVESGGAGNTTRYGGDAAGALNFPMQWYLPLSPGQGAGAVPGFYAHGGVVGFADGGLFAGAGGEGTVAHHASTWEQLVGGTKVALGQIGSALDWVDTAGGLAPHWDGRMDDGTQLRVQLGAVGGPRQVAAELAEAATAAPKPVSLSRSPSYTNHNIPLDSANYYRGVEANSFDELFDPTGVMRGAGKGGSDRLSFQGQFPNDLYVNGLVKSNMIIEGGPRLPIDHFERRSGYAFVNEMQRAAIESGEIPMRVYTRTAPEGTAIQDVHEWEKIFDSFGLMPGKAAGGLLPGYSPGVDNMLVPLSGGEGIIIPEAMRALGPQWLYELNSQFRGGISKRGYFDGGNVPEGLVLPKPPAPRRPSPARPPQPPAPPAVVAPSAPPSAPVTVAPGPEAPMPTPPVVVAPSAQPDAPRPVPPVGGPAPVASPPSSYDHNLPAVNTAISSIASTLGSAAQTAAAVGTMGVAGGGLGGGGGGPSIQGLFQLGGKAVAGLVNVGSNLLVGNITPGTTDNAYGETLRPPQKEPVTAPLAGTVNNWNIQGVDHRTFFDEVRLKESQEQQATLARYA